MTGITTVACLLVIILWSGAYIPRLMRTLALHPAPRETKISAMNLAFFGALVVFVLLKIVLATL